MTEEQDDGRFGRMSVRMHAILERDVECLVEKDREYGRSWMKRGGVGAFMMLARKWDRIEQRVSRSFRTPVQLGEPRDVTKWDIFAHLECDKREESLIDDIRDLRNYLLLVEEEMMEKGVLTDIVGESDRTEDSTGMEHPFGFEAEQETS